MDEQVTHGFTLLCVCHTALSATTINALVSKPADELSLVFLLCFRPRFQHCGKGGDINLISV